MFVQQQLLRTRATEDDVVILVLAAAQADMRRGPELIRPQLGRVHKVLTGRQSWLHVFNRFGILMRNIGDVPPRGRAYRPKRMPPIITCSSSVVLSLRERQIASRGARRLHLEGSERGRVARPDALGRAWSSRRSTTPFEDSGRATR